MEVVTFNAPIFINKVKNHSEIKNKIISSIKDSGIYSIEAGNQKISNTDWRLNFLPEYKAEYKEIVLPVFEEVNRAISSKMGYKQGFIMDIWYQWYNKGDYFGKHTHGGAMFSNVYYVQKNNNNPNTSFILNEQTFSIEVEEGDVITFPGFLIHESPVNDTEDSKVVIAYNSYFN